MMMMIMLMLMMMMLLMKCCVEGQQACCPGAPVGRGLTAEAAADLGLIQGTAVGASLIDAHAGGLGTHAPHTKHTFKPKFIQTQDIIFYIFYRRVLILAALL